MQRFLKFSILVGVIFFVTGVVVIKTDASYLTLRPITNGQINQFYLYAEELDDSTHKGIDLPANNGTNVYAVENGIVMDIEEDYPDYDPADGGFGNYVLIKHTLRHYVRQNNGQTIGQWGYVYSIYGHLKEDSVTVNVSDQVAEGQQIAQVDSTGNSSGNHLHVQIIVDPSANQSDGNNYAWTEITSRNPELWLATYNGNTGRVIGKVTDSGGNPDDNVIICWKDSNNINWVSPKSYGGYTWSRTYSYGWANPDDILKENFGTTDITPGTYHLHAYQYVNPPYNQIGDGDAYLECGETAYLKDLGTHTFSAGQTTYIGLYPRYLPHVRSTTVTGGWDSTISIQNNNPNDTAEVITTLFGPSGAVTQQQTDYLPPRGSLTINPSISFDGSAMVVGSQDISVVVETRKTGSLVLAHAYTGIAPEGSSGQLKAGKTHFLPILYRHNTWGYYSRISIQNAGMDTANVTITYRNADGSLRDTRSYAIAPFGRTRRDLQTDFTWADFFGTAQITSDQPVAVVVESENPTLSINMDYNPFAAGATEFYLPYLMKNYSGWGSCFVAQNTTSQSNVQVNTTYYSTSGSAYGPYTTSLGSQASGTVCQANVTSLPSGTAYSARITASQPVAIIVNQDNANWGGAGNQVMSYSGALYKTNTVSLPYMLNSYSSYGHNWNSGIQIQNAGTGTTNVTISFYNPSGTLLSSYSLGSINSYQTKGVYLPSVGLPANFIGSAVVSSSLYPVVAVGNASCSSGCSGDTSQTYNGVNR